MGWQLLAPEVVDELVGGNGATVGEGQTGHERPPRRAQAVAIGHLRTVVHTDQDRPEDVDRSITPSVRMAPRSDPGNAPAETHVTRAATATTVGGNGAESRDAPLGSPTRRSTPRCPEPLCAHARRGGVRARPCRVRQ